MTEPAHHAWGPSSLKQKINCLGSYQATRGLPDVDNEDSLSGTATHLLVEKCREMNVPASTFKGRTIDVLTVDGKTREFLVDQDRVDSAQTFIDHINALPGIDFNEQRIRYPEWVPGAFGTLDGARANDGTVYIRDFKDGRGIVHAKGNEQLLGCALGFYRDWGHLFEIKEFNLGIVQPRRDHVDIWVQPLEYVLEWADTVLATAYVRAQEPNPPFNPGEWCTFCKIRGTCKARAANTFDTAVGEFEDLDEAIDKGGRIAFTGQLTNDQIAKILPTLANIKTWCNDIQKYAFAEVRAGRAVGNMKIVEGQLGDRQWVPGAETELRAAAIKAGADTFEEVAAQLYEPPKLKGPVGVEKVLGKARFKPATEKKPAGDMYHLITRPCGKPMLVDGSDPRPPMEFDAASVFDDVDETDG